MDTDTHRYACVCMHEHTHTALQRIYDEAKKAVLGARSTAMPTRMSPISPIWGESEENMGNKGTRQDTRGHTDRPVLSPLTSRELSGQTCLLHLHCLKPFRKMIPLYFVEVCVHWQQQIGSLSEGCCGRQPLKLFLSPRF